MRTIIEEYQLRILLHAFWCDHCQVQPQYHPTFWELCDEGQSLRNQMRFAEIERDNVS